LSVNEDGQKRVAHNESVFRDVNERIEAGRWPGDHKTGVAFRCECGDLGCNLLLELTPAEYEHVREHPRRFFVAVGHELPEMETVVERADDYVVIEKLDVAGRAAESQDPRD
jgi:hypothetical protein